MPPIGQVRNNPGAQISPFNPQPGDTADSAFRRYASFFPSSPSSGAAQAAAPAQPARPAAPDYSQQIAAMQGSYVAPVPFNPAAVGNANQMAQINVSTPQSASWMPNRAYWHLVDPSAASALSNYNGGRHFQDLIRKGNTANSLAVNRQAVPAMANMDEAFRRASLEESLGLQQYAANQTSRNSQLMAQLAAMMMG